MGSWWPPLARPKSIPLGGLVGYFDDPTVRSTTPRHYSPVLARWLAKYPIGYVGGWNLYEYVASSPILSTDASGMGVQITMTCGLVGETTSGIWRTCQYKCVEDTTVPRHCCAGGGTLDSDLQADHTFICHIAFALRSCPKTEQLKDYCYTSHQAPLKDCSKKKCIKDFEDAAMKWKLSCKD